jgi:hypothetical protein
MNQYLIATLLAGCSLSLVGCGSDTYQPQMTETELSSAAGKNPYPYDMKATEAPHVFAEVSGNSTITIYNAGDDSYVDFTVWVNQTFSLKVDRLEARSKISLAPATFYDNKGSSMGGAPASSISKIRIYSKERLWDVQGPIVPH